MARKGHLSGDKIARTHTTIIDAAEAPVKAARNLEEVKKISLRRIRQCAGGNHRQIKFLEVKGGWKVTVVGPHSVQDIYVYLHRPTPENLKKVQDAMTDACDVY